MKAFDYHRATNLADAARVAAQPGTPLLAGGTTLVLSPSRPVENTAVTR